MKNPAEPAPPSRLRHFTPLRYPGGKGKLAAYVKKVMAENGLVDGHYVEPYAGGAAVALELMFHEYASHIHINDISRPVFCFWRSVLEHTEEFCRLVSDTPRTVEAWDVQKAIIMSPDEHDDLSLGFAMFFLNRCNRSGILNAGIIGGRDQTGPWKIDARYNAPELVNRIQSIGRLRHRISLTQLDAVEFVRSGISRWPAKTLIYCDPPYYVKGRDLYYHFYRHDDHVRIADMIQSEIFRQRWIVSYDNVPAIRDLYSAQSRIIYSIGYSARTVREGSEVMFFSPDLFVPSLVGSAVPIEEHRI